MQEKIDNNESLKKEQTLLKDGTILYLREHTEQVELLNKNITKYIKWQKRLSWLVGIFGTLVVAIAFYVLYKVIYWNILGKFLEALRNAGGTS